MIRHFSQTTLALPLLLSLTACGAEVGDDEAAECIFDAAAPQLNMSFIMATLAGEKMPQISMNKAKVKECVKSGPSTFDCMVEYSIHLDRPLPEIYSKLTGLEADDGGNLNFMWNWRFLKGTNVIRCQKLE